MGYCRLACKDVILWELLVAEMKNAGRKPALPTNAISYKVIVSRA